MGAIISFDKHLYKIVALLTTFVLITQSFSSIAETELDGPKVVCEGIEYKYEIDLASGVILKPGTDWSIKGGTIVDSDIKMAKVRWEGNGEHKLSVRVYLANALGGHWHKDLSKTATYKYVGVINYIDIADNLAFYCVGDNIQLSIDYTFVTGLEYSIEWKRYFNGNLESTYTTTNQDEVINFNINNEGKYRYTVLATESEGCLSNEQAVDQEFLVKSNALQNVTLNVIQEPTCYHGRNTIIELNIIPDYRNTNLYKYGYITPSDGEYSVAFTGSGISYDRHKFNYENPHEINEDNIQLTNQNDPPVIIKGLPAGVYEIQIENSYFCKAQFNKTISEPDKFTLKQSDPFGPLHEYSYNSIPSEVYNIKTWDGTDQVYFNLDGGTPPYKINTIPSSDTYIVLSGISAGEKEYIITDEHDCPLYAQPNPKINLKAPLPFELDTDNTATSPVDCHIDDYGDHENGTAAIYVKGGIGPYKLSYNETDYFTNSSRPNYFNITGLEEGVHEYNITHYGGDEDYSTPYETQNESFTISQPTQLDIAFSDMTPPICLGGKTGSISLVGSGGNMGSYDAANFSINLTGGVTEANDGGKVVYSGLDSIEYVFTIDDNKCEQTFPYKIESNPTPAYFVFDDISKITCSDYNDGKVTISGFDGNPDNGYYDFYLDFVDLSISPKISASSHTFKKLVPNTHTIHIADTNDCLNPINGDPDLYMKQFFIVEPLKINIATHIVNIAEKGDSTGVLNIEISGGNNNYRFVLKDTNDILIDSGKLKIHFGEPFATATSDSLKAGKYRLYIQDTCECSNGKVNNGGNWIQEEVIIQEPSSSLSFTYEVRNVSCKGLSNGKVELHGTGGWEGNGYYYGRNKDNMSQLAVFEGLSAGKYIFYVKDYMGIVFSDSVVVTEPETFTLEVGSVENVSCYGGADGSVLLNASGGTVPYEFTMNNLEWFSSNNITELAEGIYTIWAKDKNNCPAYTETALKQPDKLEVSFETEPAHCGQFDGSITASVTGGVRDYSYNWFKDDVLIVSDSVTIVSDSSLLNIETYLYEFQLTDKNGCELSAFVGISSVNGPSIIITDINTVSCSGMSDAGISFLISNGIPEYNVEIRNQNNEIIQMLSCDSAVTYQVGNLSAGDYYIWITDSENCSATESFSITSPDSLKIKLDELIQPVCFGYSNAKITVSSTGGNSDYDYRWNNGREGNMIDQLSEGDYTVTVTDSKGCSDMATYSVINPEPLQVELGEDEYLCEGQVHIINPGNYSKYEWKKDNQIMSSSQSVSIEQQGVYSIWVQDNKACNAYDTISIYVSRDLLKADFLIPSEAYENDTVIAIDISWPNPDQVIWSFDEGIVNISSEKYIEEFTFNGSGVYTISLTSLKAFCVDSLKKQIVVLADTMENSKKIELGREELILSHKVFPNPSNGEFKLEVELSTIEPIRVMVYSMQQQRYILIQDVRGQNSYSFDYGFSNLVPGIYYVIIEAGNERKTIQILILN
ncbi:MAG: T9SS type A sorting domain-containing protein [Bacteroidales bacterium]